MLGRLIALLKPLKKQYKIYFFFPFYHIGGAEKVHFQIVQAVGGNDCIIFFTKKSSGNSFLQQFKYSGCSICDVSRLTDNKWLYFLNLIWRGVVSGYINRQKERPIIFNGQCNFGYKISPWIKKEISQIELIHALNTFSYIRLPFLQYYKKKITVSDDIIQKHKSIYAPLNVPEKEFDNFKPIMNRVQLDQIPVVKDYHSNPLTVLYAGRSTFEKRPHIVAMVAKKIIEEGYNIAFEFAGISKNDISGSLQKFCNIHGDINSETELKKLYSKSHILLIPSLTESGPLVFMEAMAMGLAIISTPVGYIPSHIKNGVTGFVTINNENENEVIDEMVLFIIQLYGDRDLLQNIGKYNIEYAFRNFDLKYFNEEYRLLFEQINKTD